MKGDALNALAVALCAAPVSSLLQERPGNRLASSRPFPSKSIAP
jgi:hypothetical protein